jgi:hypothetical protein
MTARRLRAAVDVGCALRTKKSKLPACSGRAAAWTFPLESSASAEKQFTFLE